MKVVKKIKPEFVCGFIWFYYSWRLGYDISMNDLIRMSKAYEEAGSPLG